jgi:hypothetical protein
MTRLWAAFAVMLLAWVVVGPRAAQAVPPTVTPSPGYDARLQEQRGAASTSSPAVAQPVSPLTTHAPRHRNKRKR